MRRMCILLFLSLIITISFSNSSSAQFSSWSKDVTFLNIKFEKIHFRINDKDTLYAEGYLDGDAVINGYPCKGFVILSMKGKLHSFVLSEDHYMLGAEFPKGTKIDYYKDKTLISFGKSTKIQGYWCNGNYAKWWSVGIHTTLYPSGKLRSFFSTEDELVIDNVYCKCNALSNIRLHENGKLMECKLSKDQIINGMQYHRNDILEFNDKGDVIAVD